MQERKQKTNYLLPVALVMVLVVALAFGIFFMRNSLMKLTVEERSNQLEEMVTQIQANLDRAFPDKGWKVLVDTTSTHEEAGQ